eukprot:scaffold3297_cov132-Cylindrotheca_fusiformis.AAC.3
MEDKIPPPPAAAVASTAASAASNNKDDATVAECFQAVESLTALYGFDPSVANAAVNAVGTDITACCNYILDQSLANDAGGSVYPIDNCPHVIELVSGSSSIPPVQPEDLEALFQDKNMMTMPCCISPTAVNTSNTAQNNTGRLKAEVVTGTTTTTDMCPTGENWLCLTCLKVFCSRYVNGHCVEHWKEANHCIAASLADLSVWCHECQSYIIDKERILPLTQKLEEIKFGSAPPPPPAPSNTEDQDQEEDQETSNTATTITAESETPKTTQYNKYTTTVRDETTTTDMNMNKKSGDVRKTTFSTTTELEEYPMRPPNKKQRSISSSIASSDNTISSNSSTSSSASNQFGDPAIVGGAGAGGDDDRPGDIEDDDSSFEHEAKLRTFPISISEENEDDEADEMSSFLDFPFGNTAPQSLQEVAKFIQSDACQRIVILAGAGMSVVSGIPDFRSANGLYATMDADSLTATQTERDLIRLDPSLALDKRLFLDNQLPCLEVNRQFLLGTQDQVWKATLAHRFVELLHKKTKKLTRLYTQNIDGLEDQCTYLPREKVVPVHGTMDQADCGLCQNEADFEQFCRDVRNNIKDITGTDPTAPATSKHIPCRICGYNTLKPSIVLFKSNLPPRFFELMPRDVEDADLLLVIGTSLKVAPANSIVYRVPRTCLRVLVNRDPVGMSLGMQYGSYAERDYFAEGDIDPTMLELMTHLGWLDELEPLLVDQKLPESSANLLRQKLERERRNAGMGLGAADNDDPIL